MSSTTHLYPRLYKRQGIILPSSEACSATRLEVTPEGCPQLRVPGGLLPLNGEIALGYLELGYWPIPIVRGKDANWVPATAWKPFQRRAPTTEEIVAWWMRRPDAAIALACGRDAGLVVLDIDPRHGGVDPQLSAPACSTPRGGTHYHFVAPASIPELHGPGLEWLGDGHIARVPPTPGYRWLNSGLSPRKARYEQLPQALQSRPPSAPLSDISPCGNLCQILSQALGRDIRPGTTITCFCHQDSVPSLAVYPDHAFCFSQRRFFSPHRVLEGLGLAHLPHIESAKHLCEVNVHKTWVKSIAPTGASSAQEKERLAQGLRKLGFMDKAKEVEMCGRWMTREKSQEVKTMTCKDCGATFVVQSRCRYRFCPECAAIEARESLRGKEALFKEARCAIVRLPLPPLPENTAAAFARARKEVSTRLRRVLGRDCGPAYHKFLTGCRNGEFRWELVLLAAEDDIGSLEADWPYKTAGELKGLTPPQAMVLYLEVVGRPPEWETPADLAALDTILFRQRVKGSHGQAHGNSRAMKAKPRAPKTQERCPICGSSNLSWPVYRDAAGVRWFNGIPLWFPPLSGRSPPHPESDLEKKRRSHEHLKTDEIQEGKQ